MKFRHKAKLFIIFICQLVIITGLYAQEITITEEEKVPFYTLPEILLSGEGKKIDNSYEWLQIRRPEILDMFRHQVYGKVPENGIIVETNGSRQIGTGCVSHKKSSIHVKTHGRVSHKKENHEKNLHITCSINFCGLPYGTNPAKF